jgi:hypothetical protein
MHVDTLIAEVDPLTVGFASKSIALSGLADMATKGGHRPKRNSNK